MDERILLLSGSLTTPSRSGSLLSIIADRLAAAGAKPTAWDLGPDSLLPACSHLRGQGAQAVAQLVQTARHADAYVLVSPVYHGSFSGVLKNALDHLRVEHCTGKPVALASTAGGNRTPQAVDHLRLVVRALHGVAIPAQLLTVDSDFCWTGEGHRLSSADVFVRLERLINELLWFTEVLKRGGLPVGLPRELGGLFKCSS